MTKINKKTTINTMTTTILTITVVEELSPPELFGVSITPFIISLHCFEGDIKLTQINSNIS